MVANIDRVELRRLITISNVQVVDVLPAPEYTASHLPGAINIPLRQLKEASVSALRRDNPVVVY